MNPDYENKTLQNESSDEKIITEKISWAKAADSYSALLKFAKTQPCITAQEIIQLPISHSAFLQECKECTKQADIC